jgi:hypothetical protein
MSCFFTQKPYDCAVERDARVAADFVALITLPLWLPIAGVTLGATVLYMKYQKRRHHHNCRKIADGLLPHAQTVQIGDGYMYWKSENTIYILQVVYGTYTDISVAYIIRDSWTTGTNFVLAAVYDIKHVTPEYIRELESTKIQEPENDRDTIVVVSPCHMNIGNAVTNLVDGYYGIVANKFNIVFQTKCEDTTSVAFIEDFAITPVSS